MKVLISGGGTGGHIFPALAIANEIKVQQPDAQILFVGAQGKMEMEKIPQSGYEIVGLPITGIQRSLSLENLRFPFRLIKSLFKSRKLIKDFQPDCVIGTGGFASGPVTYMAQRMKTSTAIQEQNSYPGITNKQLAKKADRIYVAYDNMQHYFPQQAIRLTGNPIRKEIVDHLPNQKEAKAFFGLDSQKPVVFSVGGSLGSRTLNMVWSEHAKDLAQEGAQLLWQTGRLDYQNIIDNWSENEAVIIKEFIYEMRMAYAAADIIVSRAGAIAISELCVVGKPMILVPYPYAAEDHQTKNAQALVEKQAALMVADAQAAQTLYPTILELLGNSQHQETLRRNIKPFARPNATKEIVQDLIKLVKR